MFGLYISPKLTNIEKDVFFVLSRAWDKEKILSPHEESNLRPSDSALRCPNHWATGTPRWARSITKLIWLASCILLGSKKLTISFKEKANEYYLSVKLWFPKKCFTFVIILVLLLYHILNSISWFIFMCKQVLLLRKQNHHKMRRSFYPVLLHRIVLSTTPHW